MARPGYRAANAPSALAPLWASQVQIVRWRLNSWRYASTEVAQVLRADGGGVDTHVVVPELWRVVFFCPNPA